MGQGRDSQDSRRGTEKAPNQGRSARRAPSQRGFRASRTSSLSRIEGEIMAGRVGPHRESHEPRLLAHTLLSDGVSPVSGYLEWDGTTGVGENWGMDSNDVFGDCGAAATDHYNMAKVQDYAQYGQLGMPQYEGTLGTYGAYGIAQGETPLVPSPVGPIPGQGVDNATWLGFLYKKGIIRGYGEVVDEHVDWFTQTFRGIILGLAIDGNVASQDFDDYP